MVENKNEFYHRFYRTAGITIEVRSDLPITDDTFDPKFKPFEVEGPGADTVVIHHHFETGVPAEHHPGKEVYRQRPWAIYQNDNGYVYEWISQGPPGDKDRRMAFFNPDHSKGEIYNGRLKQEYYQAGSADALTLFPTDQILLAQILADRQSAILHSAGVIIDGRGNIFAGHSSAGKSTICEMLGKSGKILCDDRNIVRRWPDGFRVYGTWSHGDVPDVSAASAPLSAVFFLNQASESRLVRIEDELTCLKKLLECLVKPFTTPDWWNKTLDTIGHLAKEVPCHELYFDQSGEIEELIERSEEGEVRSEEGRGRSEEGRGRRT